MFSTIVMLCGTVEVDVDVGVDVDVDVDKYRSVSGRIPYNGP